MLTTRPGAPTHRPAARGGERRTRHGFSRPALVGLVCLAAAAAAADNLLSNASFDTGITGWTQYPGDYTATWDGSVGADAPGALAVTTGAAFVNSGLAQCVALSPSTPYAVQAHFMVGASSPSLPDPHIQLQWFFDSACISYVPGPVVQVYPSALEPGTWQTVSAAAVVSMPTAHGARFTLAVSNSPGGETELWYDDVFMGDASAVFADGFETGDSTPWSVAVP